MTSTARRTRAFVARVRAASLGVKLALFSALVTAVVTGIAFLALRMRAEADVSRVFVAELESSQRALRQLQERDLHLLLATSSLVSTSPTLRAALNTWRGEANAGLPMRSDLIATIQVEVVRVFGELDRDLLIVTSDSGVVLAAVGKHGVPRVGENLSRLPAVHTALSADAATADSSFGVLRIGTTSLQVGCVAILLDGYPIGALILGDRIDRVMASLGATSGTHAVITAGDAVIASTIDRAPVGSLWRGHAASDARGAELVRIGDDDYVTASLALGRTDDGRAATLHLVRSLTASLEPITTSLGRSFLIAAIVAVLLVGGGAAIVSRAALRPLARFVTFMRAGADGDEAFARFESSGGSAEIRTLTTAYNRLIDSLGHQHAELEQRTVELATSNTTLREEVRERERAEQALRQSEEALRQSQKLEALGTLAGGVAHDFNNLLSVILGYSQIAALEMAPDSRLRADVTQISDAAQRAAVLVKQLLAFSRKQVLQPQIVDLGRIVEGMESMLRRLISADVRLDTRLAPELARVTADPGQVEQVIMNLVVNARDAMPNGGTITVETSNVVLDDRFEHRPEAIAAGPAVMLVVSDTGVGMNEETRQRIFEPFFTTKAPGKGTGLGLSTVYGIVRQSGGSIAVISAPGQGTTFRCYFPVAEESELDAPRYRQSADTSTGTETILIAEDDQHLRALVKRCLESRGYRVLEAADGREALALASHHDGPIHLLLTDVVMPNLSGNGLAERLHVMRPDTRVLFTSGYSDEAIERHGVLAPDTIFLQKPIVPDVLARAVRDILDGAVTTRGGN